MLPFVTPRALETWEIPQIVEEFAHGAKNAKLAGFDGVEIHGANGYLLDQFLRDGTNTRKDRYGGSVENRARLLLEVVEAVTGVWGADRVGVRLSPSGTFNDMSDSDPQGTFGLLVDKLNPLGLAYLHIVDALEDDIRHGAKTVPLSFLRGVYRGNLIVCGGYDQRRGNAVIAKGTADAIAFGRLFIANPDLPERFRKDAPLNVPDEGTFYGGGDKGYTDYPFMTQCSGNA